MSLINQMLKDLAKRSKSYAEAELMLPQAYLPRKINFINKKTWLLTGIVFSIGFLLIAPLSFIANKKSHTQDVATASEKSPVISAAPIFPYLNTAVITGITLETQKNITSLRFLLTHDALYQLNSIPDKNQLEILIEHANITSDLPPINYIKSAISNIEMKGTEDGNVKIILTLNSGAEINYFALENAAKSPEFHLDIKDGASSGENFLVPSMNADNNNYHQNFMKSLAPEFSAKLQYDRAMTFYNEGKVDLAINLLTDLLQTYPEYFLARESLASLLIQIGNTSKASMVLDVGLHQNANYIPFIQLRARIWADQGDLTRALMLLRSINPPLRQYTDFYAFIAALYQQQGQSALASELYHQLLTLNPQNGIWWMGLGIALENMGKNAEAQEAYQHADMTNLDPESHAFVKTRLSG